LRNIGLSDYGVDTKAEYSTIERRVAKHPTIRPAATVKEYLSGVRTVCRIYGYHKIDEPVKSTENTVFAICHKIISVSYIDGIRKFRLFTGPSKLNRKIRNSESPIECLLMPVSGRTVAFGPSQFRLKLLSTLKKSSQTLLVILIEVFSK
jgi:hypothetical protein